jgi:hypothetical protein
MDPYKATCSFLVGYRFPDSGKTAAGLLKYDYPNMSIEAACQKVQGSEFSDGSNYRRSIPYAQELINEDREDNFWKDWFDMADWDDPDAWIRGSHIEQGGAPGATEPIADSWVSTNRAVFTYLPNLISSKTNDLINTMRAITNEIVAAVNSTVKSTADEILVNRRWPWWNQDGVAPEDQGTNNLVENIFASNGRLYHPTWGNKAISDKLDRVLEILEQPVPPEEEVQDDN